MRENMIAFHDLPYEEYKKKAEDTDQDAKERKVGHYAPKTTSSSDSNSQGKPHEKSSDKSGNKKTEKSSKKPQLSREEMIKQGICFTCGEKGHISKKYPSKKKDAPSPESNSIRVEATTSHHDMTPHRHPTIPTISISNNNAKPPPMYGYITINEVRSKTLFDTDESDDFVGTQFVTMNRIFC